MNQDEQPGLRAMSKLLVLCCAVGLVTVGFVLAARKRTDLVRSTSSASVPIPPTSEEYGYQLMVQTPELMGPDAPDPSLRYTGNGLSCGSCHLRAGAEPGALSLFSAIQNYPKFSPRSATIRTLEIRLNECMARSMNGKPLPPGSPQLIAMAAWIHDLGTRKTATSETNRQAEPQLFRAPDRAAQVYAGKQVFDQRCVTCHGYNGLGVLANSSNHRYVYPPVWGPDSYNTGAGMHRLLTAAPFIKSRMPLGRPDLTDDEAYDVAAYINAQPRPQMPNLEADYPDKRTALSISSMVAGSITRAMTVGIDPPRSSPAACRSRPRRQGSHRRSAL